MMIQDVVRAEGPLSFARTIAFIATPGNPRRERVGDTAPVGAGAIGGPDRRRSAHRAEGCARAKAIAGLATARFWLQPRAVSTAVLLLHAYSGHGDRVTALREVRRRPICEIGRPVRPAAPLLWVSGLCVHSGLCSVGCR